MTRATKIVATLGPASSSPEILERMIRGGVDVMRLNFSHGSAQDHVDRATLVREVAQRAGKEVAIMADLQGPKIRVGKFEGGMTVLVAGQEFILDGATTALGTNERVGLDYKDLPRDVKGAVEGLWIVVPVRPRRCLSVACSGQRRAAPSGLSAPRGQRMK